MEESGFRQLLFQLIGRLSTAREHMVGVNQYLNSARKWSRKPYMVPEEMCLESVRESVQEMYVGTMVFCVALLSDPNKTIVGMESGEALLVYFRSTEIVKRYVGHSDMVRSVAVSRDGRWMMSGWWDGTMRRWDVEGGLGIGDPLVGHEGPVFSVGNERRSRSHCFWRR